MCIEVIEIADIITSERNLFGLTRFCMEEYLIFGNIEGYSLTSLTLDTLRFEMDMDIGRFSMEGFP